MSKRKKYIRVMHPSWPQPRKFGALTVACKDIGLPYHYLKSMKMPIEYKDYLIEKVGLEDIETFERKRVI
ncbi:MAG TPA: hypothetical protein DIT39_00445 [Tissierellales bacterium]|nr:hypothetical protein [Tissierellales bacterium]